MSGEGEGIGPSEEEIKKKPERHSEEETRKRHPTYRPPKETPDKPRDDKDTGPAIPDSTVKDLYDQADDEIDEIDEKNKLRELSEEEKEEFEKGLDRTESFLADADQIRQEADEWEKSYKAALKSKKEELTSLFDDKNYPRKTIAINKAVEKFKENPENLDFEDLLSVLGGERGDTAAILESLGNESDPHTYYLLESRLASFNQIKMVLERMQKGKKIDGLDENLDLYLTGKVNYFKNSEKTDEFELFKAFKKKYSKYKPTKKKK